MDDVSRTQMPTSGGLRKEGGPSRAYYGLAAVVFLAGMAFFALFLFKGITGIEKNLTQVIVPGEREVLLQEPGNYQIFYERRSVIGNRVFDTGEGISGLTCELTFRETSEKIPLAPSSTHSTYSLGSREGVALFDFQITRPGTYLLNASLAGGGPAVVLAIGKGFMASILKTVFGGLAIFFGSVIVSITIVVMTLLKRKRTL